mmetsp:Transcript_3770/g.11940  ORF Transcript_3770/g.11940 Transcript_3770/m.11940 type:complete len:256 (+) Transcript_3770:365-1132(+)
MRHDRRWRYAGISVRARLLRASEAFARRSSGVSMCKASRTPLRRSRTSYVSPRISSAVVRGVRSWTIWINCSGFRPIMASIRLPPASSPMAFDKETSASWMSPTSCGISFPVMMSCCAAWTTCVACALSTSAWSLHARTRSAAPRFRAECTSGSSFDPSCGGTPSFERSIAAQCVSSPTVSGQCPRYGLAHSAATRLSSTGSSVASAMWCRRRKRTRKHASTDGSAPGCTSAEAQFSTTKCVASHRTNVGERWSM